MKTENYTPGHTQGASDFMAMRTLESHGAFFMPYLAAAQTVLDCGCGPGSITLGIAERVSPGKVVGVDFARSQVDRARNEAVKRGVSNAEFREGSCYTLPFPDRTFDRVFSHALFEHLTDPAKALGEIRRVLKPGGIAGICSPDWEGFLLAPPSDELQRAVAAYTGLQTRNGGDVNMGRKLGRYMAEAGFANVQMKARYECYPSLPVIGIYLAEQLAAKGHTSQAQTLRTWSASIGGMFAQAWVSAVGKYS